MARRRLSLCLIGLVVGWLIPATPARAATAKQVDASLEKAKAYLYAQQKNGTWEATPTPPTAAAVGADSRGVSGGQWTGQTALIVYALLAAGEKPQNPKLAPAVEFLKKYPAVGTYALGLRMQVWLHLPKTPDVLAAAKRDATVLLNSVRTDGPGRGMYDYVPPRATGKAYSHSRAQYGVLGMWAAEQMDIDVPLQYWHLVEQAWVSHQAPDGGWAYMKDGPIPITPGMTAVGVASLFITQDFTRAADMLAAKGNLSNPSIDRGIKWMADHIDKVATDVTYERDFPYITLYAVERIGVAAGLKYLGGVDWYQKGANWLIGKQGKAGSWTGDISGPVDTAFAMLFLARGRAPIAFNKLDYAKGQTGSAAPAWNQRPRDVANAARWVGAQIEQDLNWQVVPPTAPLSDLADAPILYVSGSKPPVLDDAEKAQLRAYVEAGGMIVGNADAGNAAFATGFRKLATELFPAYEMRELPESHPLYTGNFPRSKWKVKPSVQGLSNGVRELVLLFPAADPARQWQSRVVKDRESFWQVAGALFLYVSEGKDLRYRGENHLVVPNPAVKATRAVAVHRLEHSTTNWDPEPGGWRRMAAVALNKQRVAVTVKPVKIEPNAIPAGGLAHLTGTAKFTFTDAQRAEIKRYVGAGGTLLVEAAGGSTPFATAAETELAQLFPDAKLAVLPEHHAVYKAGGERDEPFRFRKAAQKALAGQSKTARLQGIELNGRLAVIYSREDLSAGMVGQSVDGVIGYDPESATDLTASIVAFVAGPEPKPASAPATAGSATAPAGGTDAKPKPPKRPAADGEAAKPKRSAATSKPGA
jgi:hypothetical protein